jgi:hypothetical protein
MFSLMLILVGAVGLLVLISLGAGRSRRRKYGNGDAYSPWMSSDGGGFSFGDSSGPDCSDGSGASGCDGGDGGGGGGGGD